MKKNTTAVFVLVAGLILTACSNNTETSADSIVKKDVFVQQENNKDVKKYGTIDLLFKANADIPYISLKDGLKVVNELRTEAVNKDHSLSYRVEGHKAIYSSSDNAEAIFDLKEQTITYNSFSALLNHIQSYKNTYALVTPDKNSSLHLLDNKYEKGNSYTISLKNYSQIDIYKHGEDFYLPFTTYNDLFINPTTMSNFVYNFDKVFILSSEAVFSTQNEEGENVLTPLGEAYYHSKEDNPTVSKRYAEYNYQNICLNFDYLYGVKGLKGRDYTSFDSYLSSKGYKEDLLSGDVKKMDAAYAYAASTFRDFHTVVSKFSPLYTFGEEDVDPKKYDAEMTKEEQEGNLLNVARANSGANLGFSVDEKNGIAYIAFNDFSSIDEKALEKQSWTEEDLANSVTLFAYAYKEIVDKYLGSVNYIAIDLATNNGGSADGMAYMLGILLGKFSIELQNPFTGEHAKSSFAVDINRDGKVDEGDISLREYGKQIVFIDTHFSFSCGNALPVLAKANYPEQVITIGETTGGGTCAVRQAYTAIGSMYHISGPQMISKRNGDKLDNIEMGVTADIPLNDVKAIIDRSAVANALLAKKN